MRIAINQPVIAMALPDKVGRQKDAARLPSMAKQTDNQYQADQLEARLRKQYQCQQAKKAVCNAVGFGLGVACVKTFGALGAAGFLAAHVATVKTAQHRLIKDATTDVSEIEQDEK
jgi:hypothetical protein